MNRGAPGRPPAHPIGDVRVAAYTIPTSEPESDGTLEWRATTLVVVELRAGGQTGMGYTYAHRAAGVYVQERLSGLVTGMDAMQTEAAWRAMTEAIRNDGRAGLAFCAVSAVDAALWDLKAKILGLPLVDLLGGPVADGVAAYGSGGFTSYSSEQVAAQLAAWVRAGISRVKMKVGRRPGADVERVRRAREAIGGEAELFVDANGAYRVKQALRFAEQFASYGVTWFEEPVSSDDLDGLRLLRERAPAGVEIAAGEYGFDLPYFDRMLAAGAVDVLMADASRCGGVTGFLKVAALCEARSVKLSTHCCPALHLHAACARANVVHLEYFHDHARIEAMLFEGAAAPQGGRLRPNRAEPGLGIRLKPSEAAKYAA